MVTGYIMYWNGLLPQETGCPYLEGMEEPVVQEVVFSASEARLRIIQWLVGRWARGGT